MEKRRIRTWIDEALAPKLGQGAADTNRKRSYFIHWALKEYFEALNDHGIALARRGGPSTPVEEAERDLGLR